MRSVMGFAVTREKKVMMKKTRRETMLAFKSCILIPQVRKQEVGVGAGT